MWAIIHCLSALHMTWCIESTVTIIYVLICTICASCKISTVVQFSLENIYCSARHHTSLADSPANLPGSPWYKPIYVVPSKWGILLGLSPRLIPVLSLCMLSQPVTRFYRWLTVHACANVFVCLVPCSYLTNIHVTPISCRVCTRNEHFDRHNIQKSDSAAGMQ